MKKGVIFLIASAVALDVFSQGEVINPTRRVPWWTVGNDLTNDPAIPVVYGTSTIGTTEHFAGTLDAQDFVLGTNTIERLRIKQTTGLVGIGTAAPASRLDLSGDIALREGTAIAVSTGSNAITLTGEFSHYRLTGAAGAFAINTIANGNNGQVVTLINATSQVMTVNNNNAANGILTGVGANMVSSSASNNSVTLIYNATLARWVVTSSTGMSSTDAWKITGNTGLTNPAIPVTYGTSLLAATENWIGHTDARDFVVGTNNIERFRIMQSTGRVGIGTAAPSKLLDVYSGTLDAIYGHSNNVGAYVGYETNFSFGVPAQAINGAGIFATNPTAGYTSVYAQSTGAATVAANINYSDVWMATYNYVQNGSAVYNPSVSYNQLNVTNTALGGTHIGIRGWSDRGTVAGNPGYTVGIQGITNGQNQDGIAIQGVAFTNGNVRVGGYFEGLSYPGVSQAYAYVGGTINAGVTLRKIVGTGSVSEIVPTPNHGRVTLTCPESPEYWYTDYGTVEMVSGKAHVELDPILADIIFVDKDNPLRVFCTPVNMPQFNGITVMNQTEKGFDLIELNGGKHSGRLDYNLVAKPKTNFGEGRFPQAPGPSYLKADKEPAAAKAANNPADGRKVFRWPSDYETYGYNPEDLVGIGDIIPSGPQAGKIKLGNGQYGTSVPAEKPKGGN